MKATIKKVTTEIGDTLFRVYSNENHLASFFFKDEKSEKEAFYEAYALATSIESAVAKEEVVYETGMQPIDYFAAANMTDEELSNHLKNILK